MMCPAFRTILHTAVLAAVFLQAAVVVDATYYCNRPPSLANGRHSGGNNWYFRVGTAITYQCNDGYKLEGNGRITCNYNRQSRSYYWNGTPPTCVCKSSISSTYCMHLQPCCKNTSRRHRCTESVISARVSNDKRWDSGYESQL